MRKALLICFFWLSCRLVSAQATQTPPTPVDSEMNRRLEQQLFEKWATGGGNVDPQQRRVEKLQTDLQIQEFYKKARHFVELWQSFASDLNDKRVVNVKLAQQVSKAFHDLEKSQAWPAKK